MRYVVSDVHGCLNNLEDVLKQAEFNEEKDVLYILGDIVDRGPRIWDTYLWVKERIGKKVFMILGNHEDMLMNDVFSLKGQRIIAMRKKIQEDERKYVEYFNKNRFISDQYGTIERLFKEGHELDELVEMCEFFESLPLYYELDIYGMKYTLVHAFCEENIEDTNRMDFFWDRSLAEYPSYFCNGKTVIFGHTPTLLLTGKTNICDEQSEDKKSEKINIDCGCVYGGNLALMRLEDRMVWYSKFER